MARDRGRILHALIGCAIWLPLELKWLRRLWASTAPGADGNDFTIFIDTALLLLAGQPIYESGTGFLYTPFFAWLMVPIALLPVRVAGVLWGLGKIAVFYYAASRFLPRGALSERARRWCLSLSPLLVYRFIDSDLANGNINIYLLGGIAWMQQLLLARRDTIAGVICAAVSAVKLSPLYLLGGVACTRRVRFAVVAAAGFVLLLVVPALPIAGGLERTWQGFRDNTIAVGTVLDEKSEHARGGYLAGTSLRPILHRWFTDSAAVAHSDERTTIHLIALERETVEWAYRAAAALLALAGWLACIGRPLPWSVAWCTALLLVLSPLARKAQFVFLLPAALLVLAALAGGQRPRTPALWAAAGAFILLGQGSTSTLLGDRCSDLVLAGGALLGAAVAILVGLWMIRGDEQRAS